MYKFRKKIGEIKIGALLSVTGYVICGGFPRRQPQQKKPAFDSRLFNIVAMLNAQFKRT